MDDVVSHLKQSLQGAPGIKALFLSGSHANGMADAYSDLDFVLVSEDGASDTVAAQWVDAVAQTGEIVLNWDRTTVPVLINLITVDWTRIDVVLLKPDQLRGHTQASLKPVFDDAGLYETLSAAAPAPAPNPAKLAYQFEEFIRILGLLPLAVGREEYLNGVLGIFHLRNLLVELLIEETGAPHRGGILNLNRLITQDQKDLLTSLPPPEPTRDAMIAGHLAYAKAYLPRARVMAKQLDISWPERFEDVTWERLAATLAISKPY